jgi:peptidoglycan/LPS O-acetylase OafA/YrhL
VYLFFILSGFSLWYVYGGQRPDAPMLRRFFLARFARIFPLYFLTCILAVLATWYATGLEAVLNLAFLNTLILNVTFLFGLIMPGATSAVPAGWSIGIEWVFYLFFPLALLFSRSLKTMVTLLVASLLLNQVYTFHVLDGKTLVEAWNNYTQFITFIVYFMAGITAAECYLRYAAAWRERTLWQALSRVMPVVCMAFIYMYPAATTEAYLIGWHYPLLVLAAMLAVLCASLLTPRSQMERALYEFLGNISYGTYLLHFFVYNTWALLLKLVYPQASLGLLLVGATLLTLLIAYALYHLYESPARRWINRKSAMPSGPRAALA